MSFSETASVAQAAAACCKFAGPDFTVAGTKLSSRAVEADIPAARNPGADESEWLCEVTIVGSPEDIGRQLAVIHDALARLSATQDSAGAGFEP